MPTGEGDHTHSRWMVINTVTGDVTGSIDSRQDAPHNTIVNAVAAHLETQKFEQMPWFEGSWSVQTV